MNLNVLVDILKAGVIFDFSSLEDGNMKINGGDEESSENRRIFIRKNFPQYTSLRMAEVNHGTGVKIVEKTDRKRSIAADALLSRYPKMAIATTAADCIPVLLFNKKERVVGIIHCSYLTILSDIIAKTILIAMKLKAYPEDFLVVIGPGICQDCYEIGEDVLYRYEGYEEFIIRKDGKIFADLKGLIVRKLSEAQISEDRICIYEKCTCCYRDKDDQPVFFSARREKMRRSRIKSGVAVICLER